MSVSWWAQVIHLILTKILYAASSILKCASAHSEATSPLWHRETRQGFLFHNKRISSLCGIYLHLGSVGSNHSTKSPRWQLGQKCRQPVDNYMGSLRNLLEIWEVVDNFMARLRNCTPHTSYCCKKQGNSGFGRGWEEKSEQEHSSLYIIHIDPSSK